MTKAEALEVLQISWSTLRRYVDKGLIRTSQYEMPGKRGKRNYWDDDVYALLGRKVHKGHEVVGYVRVNGSSEKDKKKMQEQKDMMRIFCNRRGISLDRIYEDYGPATDWSEHRRPQYHEMVRNIMKGNVDAVVLDTKCRLSRIGYEMHETWFKYYGSDIIVMNSVLIDPYYQQEQSDDIAKLLADAKVERIGPSEPRLTK